MRTLQRVRRGETSMAKVARFHQFIDGNTQFIGNQVTLEALGSPDSEEFRMFIDSAPSASRTASWRSSVLVASLDDVAFADNQCQCLLGNFAPEFLMTNVIVAGISVRVADNRLKEVAPDLDFSGLTMGLMNATTNNQSSACIYVYGPAAWRVHDGNRVFTAVYNECSRFADDHMKSSNIYSNFRA